MSDPASKIRIGKEHFNYVHTYQGNGIYKCVRGSDWCGIGEVLWLMKEENNNWYAFDAPETPVPTEVNPYKVNFETDDADGHIVGV